MPRSSCVGIFRIVPILVIIALTLSPCTSQSQNIRPEYDSMQGLGGGLTDSLHGTPPAITNRVNGSQPAPLKRNSSVASLIIATTIPVTNTADGGIGSLRKAIDSSNGLPGLDMITFNIGGGGLQTITPNSPLPVITGPVVIDGTTQPGFSGAPIIEINGSLAGTTANGLYLTGGSSTVRGLLINRFNNNTAINGFGIVLDVNGDNTIEGNYIGTDASGTIALSNRVGISVTGTSGGNIIGGTTAEQRNLISGNSSSGISTLNGTAGGNIIIGNLIGLNWSGTAALGNGGNGLFIVSPDNFIGGLVAGSGNLISGNTLPGIAIGSTGSGTVIRGNYIGTDISGIGILGNASNGIIINNSANNVIGGSVAGARNVISGNGRSGAGFPGVVISGASASANTVQGNFIGVGATGTVATGNGQGININGSPNNLVGGAAPGEGNVISGNLSYGVGFLNAGATGNKVVGNYIGTDSSGTKALANLTGVRIDNASNNTIGGYAIDEGNVISGNTSFGMEIRNGAAANKIFGNMIGTSAAGTDTLGNMEGIVINSAPDNVIGLCLGSGSNIIAGNANNGVTLQNSGAMGTIIQCNFIGTDTSGTLDLGNRGTGVTIIGASGDSILENTIGFNKSTLGGIYDSSGSGNVIRQNSMFSNTGPGIELAPAGITKNDSLDADLGANGLQNFPLLDSAIVAGGNITIYYRFNSRPNSTFKIDFYSGPEAGFLHFGEGKRYQGTVPIVTDAGGNYRGFAAFVYSDSDEYLTATATDSNGNTSEFSQAMCMSDADGDGIMDCWETQDWGIDVNSDGVMDLDLYALGARTNHKDVFVEIDAMSGYAPPPAALSMVAQSFDVVPNVYVTNPDNMDGIKLHYLLDQTTIPIRDFPNTWTDFDTVKKKNFGTLAEWADSNSQHILAAKKLVYRYGLWARTFGTSTDTLWSGIAELTNGAGGVDFMVTFGSTGPSGWNGTQNVDVHAGTFMHELGHTFGLWHGGNNNQQYKPNYYSVMNYTWQVPIKRWLKQNSWRLNFSTVALPALSESILDETLGLNPPAGIYPIVPVPYTDSLGILRWARLRAGVATDWSGNGDATNTTTAVDLNLVGDTISSPGEFLNGFADWPNLKYNFRKSPAFNSTSRPKRSFEVEEPELTPATLEILNNLPLPKPTGQFMMDGQIDTSATLLASEGGIQLFGKYLNGQLYVATNSAQSQGADMFIFVSDSQNVLRNVPWGKSGQVAAWSVFLGNESTDNSFGWFDSGGTDFESIVTDTTGTVLEGVIDVEYLFGLVPEHIFLAAGRYGTNPGDPLISQAPAGNGDGNIDSPEFIDIAAGPPAPTIYFAQQGGKIIGSGSVGSPVYHGSSVALSSDGKTAIAGGYGDSGNVGAAWIYTRDSSGWSQQGSKLVGTGATGPAYQGESVAISGDGNTAIVGGRLDDIGVGAAWVFTRSGGVWTQQGSKLVGSDEVGLGSLGHSVAISEDGNTAIAGGSTDDNLIGAAWVFTRSSGVWTQQGGKLVGTNALGTPLQGTSVSISADGNTAVMGGELDDVAGAVWVFTRSGGTWSQQGEKLVGSPADTRQGHSASLSADGNTLLIGHSTTSTGGAWVFTRTGGVWNQQGSKLVGTAAAGYIAQGQSVALSGDGNTALIGGIGDNSLAGASWVFTRKGDQWKQAGDKLIGTGAVNPARQGWSTALSSDGNIAMVGGLNDDLSLGAAWVFDRDTLLPTQLTAFTATIVDGDDVLLAWTTLNESNTYGFEIQRSPGDQNMYSTLPNSFIPGAGTTNMPRNYSLTDSGVPMGLMYYRLRQIDLDSTIHYSAGVTIDITTGVVEESLPDKFALYENYPDPFNPATTIQYQLPQAARVVLKIYNVLGQEVVSLVDEVQSAGVKSVVWKAGDVAGGVYFYRIMMTAGGTTFTEVRKMLVMK